MNRVPRAACFALLAACWTPDDTGPTTMVGVIRGPDGAALADLPVATLEARATTDARGRFGVSYKAPAQWVRFEHGGLRWRRAYRPEDDGRVVEIDLPDLSSRVLACELPLPCTAELTWDLSPSLRASLRADCELADRLWLPMPEGEPEGATCRQDPASPEEPVATRPWRGANARNDLVEGVEVFPSPVALTLRLETTGGALPSDCEVFADGEPAQPQGNDRYVAQVWGWVPAWARCDGKLGPPTVWRVQQESEVALAWAPPTTHLDLRQHHPDVSRVTLAKPARPGPGWVVPLPANPDGTWQLPSLRPGRYQIGLDAPDTEVLYKDFRPDMPPNIVFVEGKEIAERRDDGSLYGVLDLTKPLPTGAVRVAWATEEYEVQGLPSPEAATP